LILVGVRGVVEAAGGDHPLNNSPYWKEERRAWEEGEEEACYS